MPATWGRHLPELSDRERIATARYAAEKLAQVMRRRLAGWVHRTDPMAGILSRRWPSGK